MLVPDDEVLRVVMAPYFVAGVCFRNDVVTRAPPIVKYMIGWNLDKFTRYVTRKGWTISLTNL